MRSRESGSKKKGGRPEACQHSPDARETEAVSESSLPSIESRVIETADEQSRADPGRIYYELLNDPPNPVQEKLAHVIQQLENGREQMLELLREGRGPECTESWSRLAGQLQSVILDLDQLRGDLDCAVGGRGCDGGPALTWVAWHAAEVYLCANHEQCTAAIADAARDGFDLNGLEIAVDAAREVAHALRGPRLRNVA